MKLIRKRGSTSNIWQIFIRDSSVTTAVTGLTGLTNASSGLTAYFHRDVDTTATAISLVSMTVGTFTSGGFKEIDATHMPGWYQFCPPDTALSATSTPKSVALHLQGATNMEALPIEVELGAHDPEDTIATATENADALLKRDMSAVSGESARSPLNAFRFLRNKWSISAGTLTVTKEDDTTSSWTASVTQTAGNPVSAVDPA